MTESEFLLLTELTLCQELDKELTVYRGDGQANRQRQHIHHDEEGRVCIGSS